MHIHGLVAKRVNTYRPTQSRYVKIKRLQYAQISFHQSLNYSTIKMPHEAI